MSYVAICIDMQSHFRAANNLNTQRNCVRELKKAIKDKATIIFVEYENCGSTLPILLDILKKSKYKKYHTVLKKNDDGGREVINFLRAKHLPRLNLRVFGVNTPYCVKRTVYGMRRNSKNSTISVIADACHSEWGEAEHQQALTSMSKRGIKVLNNCKKK